MCALCAASYYEIELATSIGSTQGAQDPAICKESAQKANAKRGAVWAALVFTERQSCSYTLSELVERLDMFKDVLRTCEAFGLRRATVSGGAVVALTFGTCFVGVAV
jgi:hypothetical protein